MKYATRGIGNQVIPIPPTVSLDKQDFRAEGGQAKVYVQGNLAYKIYHDPKHCIPVQKMEELASLDVETVIRPLGVVFNATVPVGLVMKRIDHAIPLARLSSETFCKDHKVSLDLIIEIIRQLRDTIATIHTKRILIVDVNEMNFVCDEKTWGSPYCIDVDSYQTPHFPANAIVPSIRDYRAKGFNEGTDWFSFGILACHLMIGLHPFRGKHPKYPVASIEDRIKNRASIFDKGVTIPPATRDFSVIPDDYRKWFLTIFQQGKSIAAPENDQKIIVLLTSSRKMIIREWDVMLKSGKVVKVSVDGGIVKINGMASMVRVDKIFVVDNCVYGWKGENFAQVKLNEFGLKIIASLGTIWRVLPNATTMLEGLLYQDVLGQPYLTIPLQPGICRTVHISEIVGYKLVDGKYESRIVELILFQKGDYHRIQLKFAIDGTYTIHWEKEIDYR